MLVVPPSYERRVLAGMLDTGYSMLVVLLS